MKYSVIMPSYLQPYESEGIKSASSPQYKFLRAVNSFLNQSFKDAELIIISDGCIDTEMLYLINYSTNPRIKFKRIEKQPVFSGKVRQMGIGMAIGEVICYLDHDDYYGSEHLKIINSGFDTANYDWAYFNDYMAIGVENNKLILNERYVEPTLNYIGTSMIAHKRDVNVLWDDGYTHDWKMINNCLLKLPGIRIPTPEYYVCHFHQNDF